MARPIRVEYADAVYHVTARGNERKAVFRDDADRLRLVQTLAQMAQTFGVVIHAWCLMPNHYHLLLQTPRANLSAAVGWLQTTYSVRFNRRHRRSGHLFQGRFKAHLVEEDAYAAELIRYIHLNPVRPRDKGAPIPPAREAELSRYRWSSHRAYAGLESAPPWLCLDWLSHFAPGGRAAQKQYRREIQQMFGQVVRCPWLDLRQGLVLGGQALWDKVRSLVGREAGDEELRWHRRADADEHARKIDLLAGRQSDRRLAIWLRVRLGGERMTALAAEYGYRDGSGIHRVVQRLEARTSSDRALAEQMKGIKREVSSVKS